MVSFRGRIIQKGLRNNIFLFLSFKKKIMKPFSLIIIALLVSLYSFSQVKRFDFASDADSLLKAHPQGFAVYLSAFWCGPCIGKSKTISIILKIMKRASH